MIVVRTYVEVTSSVHHQHKNSLHKLTRITQAKALIDDSKCAQKCKECTNSSSIPLNEQDGGPSDLILAAVVQPMQQWPYHPAGQMLFAFS